MREESVKARADNAVNRLCRLRADRIDGDRRCSQKEAYYQPVGLTEGHGSGSLQTTETAEAGDHGNRLSMKGGKKDDLPNIDTNRDGLCNDGKGGDAKRGHHDAGYADPLRSETDRGDEGGDAREHCYPNRRTVSLHRTQGAHKDAIDRTDHQQQAANAEGLQAGALQHWVNICDVINSVGSEAP